MSLSETENHPVVGAADKCLSIIILHRASRIFGQSCLTDWGGAQHGIKLNSRRPKQYENQTRNQIYGSGPR